MVKRNRFLKYWHRFLGGFRSQGKSLSQMSRPDTFCVCIYVCIYVLVALVFAFSLLNASILNAQSNFTPTELFQLEWGNGESRVGLLKVPGANFGPQSFAIDERNNKIYILDSANQRVLIYDLSGNLFSSVPISQRADDLVLGIESIYILYRAEMKVVEYSLDGTTIATYPLIDTKSPVVGIRFNSGQGLSFETAEGTSYPLMEKGIKVSREDQIKRKIMGLSRNSDYFSLERKGPSQGIIKILDHEGKTKKELPIEKKEQGIETLTFVDMDDAKNIYIVVEESTASSKIKRYLRNYDPMGVLLAEAIIPYSNYAYTFKDLQVTGDGKVYQILPLKEHVKVLVWSLDIARSELFDEPFDELFSHATIGSEDFIPGDIVIEQTGVESQDFFILASIGQNEIISRAESYRTHSFYVSSSNITPSGGTYCGGKIVKTPVSTSGWYTGILYKWGGFSGLTGVTSCTNDIGYCYDEGLSVGKYAGDKCTAFDPSCSGIYYGSSCAVGVDCSGFVSRTWGLSTKQSTTTLPSYSCSLGSKDYLVAGDILNSTQAGHVLLFSWREANGSFTIYEAGGKAGWKVGLSSYSLSELTNNGYLPYRYKNLTGVFQINDIVQANASGVRVRNCAGLSCTELCAVSTGDSGRVVGGPLEADGYTWWQITWNTGSCSGITGWSAGCYLQKAIGDTTPPTISAFSVTPSSVTVGNPFTISYTVSDTGGSGLNRIELQRARDTNNNNIPDPGEWSQVDQRSLSGNGPVSGSFSNTPPQTGTYWYGIHIIDNAGNRTIEPSPPGPIRVTVTTCTYSISPTSRSHGSGAESGSVSLTTSSGCSWTATSNAAWITITSGSSGSGSGTVYYSVSTNTSTNSRTGTLTIAGQTFTVTQAACPTPGTPSNPSPANGATGQPTSLTLSWSSTSNTDSYDVYFGTSSSPPYVGNTTSTSYSRSGLSYNTPYYWKIISKNNCGNSTSGPLWSFTTSPLPPPPDTTPPPAPINLTATPSNWTNNSLFTIDWANPSDPSGIAGAYFSVCETLTYQNMASFPHLSFLHRSIVS